MKPVSKFSIVVTVIALIAISLIVVTYRNQTHIDQTPLPTPTPSVGSWPSHEVDKKTISDSNQYYDIEIEYPVTSDAAINNTFATFAEDQVKQFKDDTAWVTDPSIGSAAEGTLSLSVSYVELQSSMADSYVFTIATYTGGAHGLQVTKVFTFTDKGTPITLENLFIDQKKGLEVVAAFVQKELTKKNISDADWIKDGAAATPENYQNFVVSDEGVTFMFDPYQVAPYAAGIQKILVPHSVLKPVINPKL